MPLGWKYPPPRLSDADLDLMAEEDAALRRPLDIFDLAKFARVALGAIAEYERLGEKIRALEIDRARITVRR